MMVAMSVLACKEWGSSASSDRAKQPAEAFTLCTSDHQCTLSCLDDDECCTPNCACDRARHTKDHREVSNAHDAHCEDFDYATCPYYVCPEPEHAIVPRCRWGKCVAEEVKREPPPAVDLAGYDKSCASDEDCTVVLSQPCSKCACVNEPLATSQLERFRSEMASIDCPPYDPWPEIDCGGCVEYEAYCDAGQCKARSG
jgi:hypothetical protein